MKPTPDVPDFIPFAHPGPPILLGWYRGLADLKIRFGYHPELEIQFLRRGAVIYTVQGTKYQLLPNSLLVIYPNERHLFRPACPSAAFEKISFMLKPSFVCLPADGSIAGRKAFRHMSLSATEAHDLTRIASDVQAEFTLRSAEWMAMCRLKVRELLILVKRASVHPIRTEVTSPVVTQVLDMIDQCVAKPVANEFLARRVGISTSRLMHLFAAHTGLSIKQYSLLMRMGKACEMLAREPGLKVEAVAHAVGFKYFADFNRVFKAHTRLTPTEYRSACDNRRPNGSISHLRPGFGHTF